MRSKKRNKELDEMLFCMRLSVNCKNLNDAHKDPVRHEILKKRKAYQDYIIKTENLNEKAHKLGYKCRCAEVNNNIEHTGHRMIKR
jgi:hypothetical protein